MTPDDRESAQQLKKFWKSNKRKDDTYDTFGARELATTGPNVSHYINGNQPLNPKVATIFANYLGIAVELFATRQLLDDIKLIRGSSDDNFIDVPLISRTKSSAEEPFVLGAHARHVAIKISKEFMKELDIDSDLSLPGALITSDGSFVIVDRSDKLLTDGYLYAIDKGPSGIEVKRSHRQSRNTVILTTAEEFGGAPSSPEMIKIGDLGDIQVIGKAALQIANRS